MPLYLHQTSRVCTWSQPYFIGPGSVRRHEVPISAIPCLKYLKELEKEGFKTQPGIIDLSNRKKNEEPVENGEKQPCDLEDGELPEDKPKEPEKIPETPPNADGQIKIKNATLITAEERQKTDLIDAESLREYCTKRFAIAKRQVAVFDSWRSRRVFKKVNGKGNRPQLPKHAKLITLPILAPGLAKVVEGKEGSDAAPTPPQRRHRVFNPAGKSYVSILHEVVFFSLSTYPDYKYNELTDASNPYAATVIIKVTKFIFFCEYNPPSVKGSYHNLILNCILYKVSDLICSILILFND